MVSRPNRIYCRRAFSLVEAMISVVMLVIAVIGTASYRYCAALEVRRSDAQVTAARMGLMVFEGWRGANGNGTYDPVTCFSSDLEITELIGSYNHAGFALLGVYKVTVDDIDYYVLLSSRDVQPGLKRLNIVVDWSWREELPAFWDSDELFKLTGYVEN